MTSPVHIRNRYRLTLPALPASLQTRHPTGGVLRHPLPEETEALAELMLDAYRGTVDDAGETTDDALAEAEGYFAGQAGEPLLDCSWVYDSNGTLLSACLVTLPNPQPQALPNPQPQALHEREPVIAYVMTRSRWQGRGIASYLLRQSLLSLQDARYAAVGAVVTEGNRDSETLLTNFGFSRA